MAFEVPAGYKRVKRVDGTLTLVPLETAYPSSRVWDEDRKCWCTWEEYDACRPIWAYVEGGKKGWEQLRVEANIAAARERHQERVAQVERKTSSKAGKAGAGEDYASSKPLYDEKGKLQFGAVAPKRRTKKAA